MKPKELPVNANTGPKIFEDSTAAAMRKDGSNLQGPGGVLEALTAGKKLRLIQQCAFWTGIIIAARMEKGRCVKYMCIYKYMEINRYAYVYIYICKYTYKCIYIYVYNICIYVCM